MFLQLACYFSIVYAVLSDSCSGRCGQSLDGSASCQCNTACEEYNDCCQDYAPLCKGATCAGRCGAALDNSKPCQCNTACVDYGDCCADYQSLCDGEEVECCNSCDIHCIVSELWKNDQNKTTGIQLNRQAKASNSDNAPQKLFAYVNEEFFARPTYQKFIALLDNYNVNTGQTENLNSAEQLEIEDFLSTLLRTQMMQKAKTWLAFQGKNVSNFESRIRESWFELYSRSSGGPVDSSGFEHVMVGEVKGDSVNGFHNWIQFYLQEKENLLNYLGYADSGSSNNNNVDVMAAKFTWNGVTKNVGSFFVGTSPEFEFAVYTICSILSPNARCNFNIAGKSYSIQTWDVSHKSGFQFGSAYPVA